MSEWSEVELEMQGSEAEEEGSLSSYDTLADMDVLSLDSGGSRSTIIASPESCAISSVGGGEGQLYQPQVVGSSLASDSESRATDDVLDAFDRLSITSDVSQDTSVDNAEDASSVLTTTAVAALEESRLTYISPARFIARANNIYGRRGEEQNSECSSTTGLPPRSNIQVGKRKQRRKDNDQLLSLPRHLLPRTREKGATKLFPIPEFKSHFGSDVLGPIGDGSFAESEVRQRFSAGYNSLKSRRRAERRARRVRRMSEGSETLA